MSKYNRAFKCQVAKQYLLGNYSSYELSQTYPITPCIIRYWEKCLRFMVHDSFQPHVFAKNAQAKLQALEKIWTNG